MLTCECQDLQPLFVWETLQVALTWFTISTFLELRVTYDLWWFLCWHHTHNMLNKYSRVSFCDGSFCNDSFIRPLLSRTEHSRIVVDHCRNSSILSLLSVLLALHWCACVSSFFFLVQFFWVDCYFSTHDVHQKDRKEEKIKTGDITSFLDVFWTTAWAVLNKIKSDLIDFFIICVIFYIPNSLN